MTKKAYGCVPKIFRYYAALYPYILSVDHLFELVTHVAWRGRLYYGWTRKLLSFVDNVPPSYVLANPKGDQKDYNLMIEDIFQRIIEDETYLSDYYETVFEGIDWKMVLEEIDIKKRDEFTLYFEEERPRR